MASTFKLLLAAAVLSRVDRGKLRLEEPIPIRHTDMVAYAPVTSKHLDKGSITVRELCTAMVELSDNPAANLLFPLVDGPAGLTGFLRAIGDETTRSDRLETDLNSKRPGDVRDTTTPRAMVGAMQAILTGAVLTQASRELLIQWLVNSPTGTKRLRAGLPPDWVVGDKTGSGANGASTTSRSPGRPGCRPTTSCQGRGGRRPRCRA